MRAAIHTYSQFVSGWVGRFGKWEGRAIGLILFVCTGLVLFYGSAIFETLPTCDPKKTCNYLLPTFVGDVTPSFIWVERWREYNILFDSRDIEMSTLTELGRSGALRDPMMASGFIAALFVLWLSVPLDRLYRQMVRQMEQDGLVPRAFRALAEIETQRRVWAWTLAVVICLIMFFATLNYHEGYPEDLEKEIFLWGSSALGIIAGHRMGTALAYGQFARRFQEVQSGSCLLPGHADKMGGWQRFGEFMAYQTVLMFIPLMWLATWIFVAMQSPGTFVSCFYKDDLPFPDRLTQSCNFDSTFYSTYAGWVQWQIPLLLIMIVVAYLGLVRPFFKATIPYRKDRARLMNEHVAQLDGPLSDAVALWHKAESLQERQAASKAIGDLTAIREGIWALPRVPLRSTVTGVFSVSTFYPLVVLALSFILPKDDELTGAIGLVVSLFKDLGL